MKVLLIGDVSANPGIQIVKNVLHNIRSDYDLIVANSENSASSSIGATKESVESLLEAGVDVLTSGNHWFHSENLEGYPVIRPHNFIEEPAGRGWIEVNGIQIMNLVGELAMPTKASSIFDAAEGMLFEVDVNKPVILDFHAQLPYEKLVLANYLDGRVSAVVGTHSHVATCDEVILPKGTAYVTDLGMCGAINSVIGCDVTAAIWTVMSRKYEIVPPAEGGSTRFNAVEIILDGLKASSIKRVDFKEEIKNG